jgi:hypothetical protein
MAPSSWPRSLVRWGAAAALAATVLLAGSSAHAARLRVVTFNVAMGIAFGEPMAGMVRTTFTRNRHLARFDVIGLQ